MTLNHPTSDISVQVNSHSSEQAIHSETKELVAVWVDTETIFRNFAGGVCALQAEIDRLTRQIYQLGSVASVRAFGDFELLSRKYGCNLKQQLKRAGFQCWHQKNIRGKNSADMAMATDILDTLWYEPDISTVVLATSDRDFRPVID